MEKKIEAQARQLAEEIRNLNLRLKKIQKKGFVYSELELIIQDKFEYAEGIVNTIHEPLVILDVDLKVISINKSFEDLFKVPENMAQGKFIYDLGDKQWDIPELRNLLSEVLPKHKIISDFEVQYLFSDIGKCSILVNAQWIPRDVAKPQLILLAFEDITKRKNLEEKLKNSYAELELRVKVRTAELSKANEELQKEIVQRRKVERELGARMHDLEEFTKIVVDRELKMEELEIKIKELEEKIKGK
ncbi:MAG: PAS domain-containing protein [Candidatus Omnitrophota bacterium]